MNAIFFKKELEDAGIYLRIIKRFGLDLILPQLLAPGTSHFANMTPDHVRSLCVMTTNFEYLTTGTSFFGFKIPWTTWLKCQCTATFSHMYLFKLEKDSNPNIRLEFDLNSCVYHGPESEIEIKKPFSFSIRNNWLPNNEKMVIAAPDSKTLQEWREFFFLCSETYRPNFLKFLNKKASVIQKYYRGYRYRKTFLVVVRKIVRLQALFRGASVRRMSNIKLKAIIKLQSFFRMVLAKQELQVRRLNLNIAKHHKHRTHIVQEILATEESYVKDLENAIRFFYTPLKALFPDSPLEHTKKEDGKSKRHSGSNSSSATSLNAYNVSSTDIKLLFLNMDEIRDHHLSFLGELRKVVEQWHENTLIAPLFIEMCSWLNIYVKYCNNYDDSLVLLEKCQKNELFLKFMDSIADSKDLKKLTLESFLIAPVQRVPRYELLLRDLLKHTWKEHPDRKNLQEAFDGIRKSISKINESKRVDSTKKRLEKFQLQLKDPASLEAVLVEGNYVTEGPVLSIEEGKPIKSYLFLFEDQLVLARRSTDRIKEGKLNYRKTYRFYGTKFIPLLSLARNAESLEDTPESEKENIYQFEFDADNRHYLFTVKEFYTRNNWVKEINAAREKSLEKEKNLEKEKK